jgi:hypothetical protein
MCNGITYWYSPAGSVSLRAIGDQIAEFALAMAGSGMTTHDAPAASASAEAEEAD